MKDLKFGLIVLFVSIMIVGVLVGITVDTVLTDIRNLKENDVYWLRNQVAALQEQVDLQRVGQDLILRDLGHVYRLHNIQNEWLIDVYCDFRDTFRGINEDLRLITENTRQKTFDEIMEEATEFMDEAFEEVYE